MKVSSGKRAKVVVAERDGRTGREDFLHDLFLWCVKENKRSVLGLLDTLHPPVF